MDTDLLNNAFFYDPLIFNSDYFGENNPESYKIQNNSPAVGAGYLINGSLDTTDYIHNNGGFDYFGNHVSHETGSNIGAFNGLASMNILTNKNGDLNLYPSITKDIINIYIKNYTGNIQSKLFSLKGDLLSVQDGDVISLKEFDSGTYFCVVKFGKMTITQRVVKI